MIELKTPQEIDKMAVTGRFVASANESAADHEALAVTSPSLPKLARQASVDVVTQVTASGGTKVFLV